MFSNAQPPGANQHTPHHSMSRAFLNIIAWTLLASGFAERSPAQTTALRSDAFSLVPGSSLTASTLPNERWRFPGATQGARQVISDLEEAIGIIEVNHVSGSASRGRVIRTSIEGMLSSLDPHSTFFSPEEFDDFLDEQHGEYSGIGTTIATHATMGTLETYFLSCRSGSPASRAGIEFGDRLVSVDGRAVSGLSSEEVRDLVKGQAGTKVTIVFERAGSESLQTRELTRANIVQKSVQDFYMIRPGIGYIDLTDGFSDTTYRELRSAITSLKRDGMNSLLLDLRGNPGGLLVQAVDVAGLFLPAGRTVVSQRGRRNYDNFIWRSTNPRPEAMPLVVLVDGMTASAAEILAGALQDYNRAVIVGEATFGKGLVQSVIDLPSRNGLTLTTARYYTPAGRSLQRDYARTGAYDYFSRNSGSRGTTPSDPEVTSYRGRLLTQGDGIRPDVVQDRKANAQLPAPMEARLFDFIRKMDASALSRNLQPSKEAWHAIRLSERVMEGFLDDMCGADDQTCRTGLKAFRDGIELHLRYLLAIADVGTIRAKQVKVEHDPVVLRALEEMATATTYAAASLAASRK